MSSLTVLARLVLLAVRDGILPRLYSLRLLDLCWTCRLKKVNNVMSELISKYLNLLVPHN
jgi:hypothetical protein